MEKSAELLDRVAASEPIARKLDAIQRGQWSIQFSHVIQPAQPFLAAVIAYMWHRLPADNRQDADSTIWVLCPTVHTQEVCYESLLNWQPDALFLPEAELAGIENVLPDPEIAAERLALFLQIELNTGPRIIVATRVGLNQAAPRRGTLESAVVLLRRGAIERMEDLVERLATNGYERVPQVTTRGQFAVRGGIIDLHSWQAPMPFRLEFFGDQIESLREFDIDTQTSVRDLRSIDVLLAHGAADQSGSVRDYVCTGDLIIEIEQDMEGGALARPGSQELGPPHIQISEGWIESGPEDFSGAFQDCEIGEFGAGDLVLAEAKRAQFVQRLKEWRANNARILIYFQTEGEIERFREIMSGAVDGVDFVEGTLTRGFCFSAANLVVLSAAELFGRFAIHPRRLLRLRRAERHRVQIDFRELAEGDLVVHLEHGIGRFLGLEKNPVGQARRLPDAGQTSMASGALALQQRPQPQEVLVLEFADEAKLYVPSSRRISFRAMLAQEKNHHH